jgi:hypothetical protein
MAAQTPLEPPDFRGKPQEFLAWAKANHQWNPSWCPRHWLPCPVDGRNGLLATVRIMQLAVEQMPTDVAQGGPTAMNSWMANQTRPLCCRLGDARMAELWAGC